MTRKLLAWALASSVLTVTGCVSVETKPDTRTPEQKRAENAAAIAELQGSYDVVESRNTVYNNVEPANIKPKKVELVVAEGGKVLIRLIDGERAMLVTAAACEGNARSATDYYSIFCSKGMPGISMAWIYKETGDREVKSGAIISAFEPMQVHKGEYLLEIVEQQIGRPHYYKLKKSNK